MATFRSLPAEILQKVARNLIEDRALDVLDNPRPDVWRYEYARSLDDCNDVEALRQITKFTYGALEPIQFRHFDIWALRWGVATSHLDLVRTAIHHAKDEAVPAARASPGLFRTSLQLLGRL
jgi:hypothetical protein